jgi:hypothetical protein
MSPNAQEFGWSVESALPDVLLTRAWLEDGMRRTHALRIVVECETEVLEFVYLELRDGRLLVSDRGDIAKFCETGDDFHRPLDTSTIRDICESAGAMLIPVREMWPHITVNSRRVHAVADAIRIVGRAMDRVMEAALIVPESK